MILCKIALLIAALQLLEGRPAPDDNNRLVLAIQRGSLKAVTQAVEQYGVSVLLPDLRNGGLYPLHYAVLASPVSLEIIEYLRNQGAMTNVTDNFGRTPLHYAASQGNVEIVSYLVRSGAGVNVVDRNGRTPLDDALEQNHEEVSAFLRECGDGERSNSNIAQAGQLEEGPKKRTDELCQNDRNNITCHLAVRVIYREPRGLMRPRYVSDHIIGSLGTAGSTPVARRFGV